MRDSFHGAHSTVALGVPRAAMRELHACVAACARRAAVDDSSKKRSAGSPLGDRPRHSRPGTRPQRVYSLRSVRHSPPSSTEASASTGQGRDAVSARSIRDKLL